MHPVLKKLWKLLGKPAKEVFLKCLQKLVSSTPSTHVLYPLLVLAVQKLTSSVSDEVDGSTPFKQLLSADEFSTISCPVRTKVELLDCLKSLKIEFSAMPEAADLLPLQSIFADREVMSTSSTTAHGHQRHARMCSSKASQSRVDSQDTIRGQQSSQQSIGTISSIICSEEGDGKSNNTFLYQSIVNW